MVRFYLGTHEPSWLARSDVDVPLFVSRVRLARLKRWPRAVVPWALDSGGFTELAKFGGWTLTAADYVREVRRAVADIGGLEWASAQDWMCEPAMLARTGLTVLEHQRLTVANYLELLERAPDLPFVPVLQGWTLADYATRARGARTVSTTRWNGAGG